MSRKKRVRCAVKNCENHTDEGEFVGSLCFPCHSYLAGDARCRTSQACRNEEIAAKAVAARELCTAAVRMLERAKDLDEEARSRDPSASRLSVVQMLQINVISLASKVGEGLVQEYSIADRELTNLMIRMVNEDPTDSVLTEMVGRPPARRRGRKKPHA